MSDEPRKKKLASAMIILGALIVASIFVLRYGQGEVDKGYFNLYMWFAVLSILHGVIVLLVDYTFAEKENTLAKALYLYDHDNPLRPFSNMSMWIWFVAALFLGVILFASIALNSFSLYNLPNAYSFGVEPLNVQGHSFLSNLLYGAIIPGLFEEWIVFAGIQALTSIIIFAFALSESTKSIAKSNAFYLVMVLLVAGGVTAYYAYEFSTAHGRYGGNEPVFLYAWGFEFTVQLINQLGGQFVSWIPHILHNSGVVSNQTMALMVGEQWSGVAVTAILVVIGMASTYAFVKLRRGRRA